jgi:hypothetical protein
MISITSGIEKLFVKIPNKIKRLKAISLTSAKIKKFLIYQSNLTILKIR